jgi:hypothetical protein
VGPKKSDETSDQLPKTSHLVPHQVAVAMMRQFCFSLYGHRKHEMTIHTYSKSIFEYGINRASVCTEHVSISDVYQVKVPHFRWYIQVTWMCINRARCRSSYRNYSPINYIQKILQLIKSTASLAYIQKAKRRTQKINLANIQYSSSGHSPQAAARMLVDGNASKYIPHFSCHQKEGEGRCRIR